MDFDKVQRLIELKERKAEAEKLAEQLKGEAEVVEAEIIAEMDAFGVEQLTVKGVTIKITERMDARMARDRADVVKALYDCGLGEMVFESWSPSTVSKWFREQAAAEAEIPEAMRNAFELNVKRGVRY